MITNWLCWAENKWQENQTADGKKKKNYLVTTWICWDVLLRTQGKRMFYFVIFKKILLQFEVSLVVQLVKNPPAMQETLVWFLGQKDPLEKGRVAKRLSTAHTPQLLQFMSQRYRHEKKDNLSKWEFCNQFCILPAFNTSLLQAADPVPYKVSPIGFGESLGSVSLVLTATTYNLPSSTVTSYNSHTSLGVTLPVDTSIYWGLSHCWAQTAWRLLGLLSPAGNLWQRASLHILCYPSYWRNTKVSYRVLPLMF